MISRVRPGGILLEGDFELIEEVDGIPQFVGTLSNWVLGNMANNLAVAPDRFSNPCLTPAGARTVSPSPSVTTWSPRIASRLPSMMTMASSLSGWMWVVTRPPGPISRWLMYNDRAPWVASPRTARSTVVAEDRAAGWVHWFGSVRRIQAIICSRREIR